MNEQFKWKQKFTLLLAIFSHHAVYFKEYQISTMHPTTQYTYPLSNHWSFKENFQNKVMIYISLSRPVFKGQYHQKYWLGPYS